MQLSSASFHRARAYLIQSARPLERARFQYHFEGGTAGAVLQELAVFQNGDGGFGHGLEPDIRTPHSSAIATAHAFEILRAVGAEPSSPLVRRGVDYLLQSFDAEPQVWPILPPQAGDAPHAPWWDQVDLAENFGHFRINPTVALIGHLTHYAGLVPPDLLISLHETAVARLVAAPQALDMHDVKCYLDLVTAWGLPTAVGETILETLIPGVPHLILMEPARWSEYGLTPLDAAPTPTAPLAHIVSGPILESYLDYMVDQQGADGAWPIRWSWAFVDATAWAQAEQEWKGIITLQSLRGLQAHGRLAGR